MFEGNNISIVKNPTNNPVVNVLGSKQIIKNSLVWLDGKDFSNNPSTASWIDRSYNGNNATPTNMSYTTSSGSDNNGGLVLDGVNDYVDLGNKSVFDFTSNFTIELLAKFPATVPAAFTSLLGKFVNGQNQGYAVGLQTGSIRLALYGTSSLNFGSGRGPDLRDNKKHHIVLLVNNSYASYYLDGQLAYSQAGTWTPTLAATASLKVGTMDNLSYINNTLYAFRLYNRILSQSEILQNYNALK